MAFRKVSHNLDMDEAGRDPKKLRIDGQVASSDQYVLNNMPVELVTAVTKDLITPDVYETVDNLSNVRLTSRFNHQVVTDDPELRRIYSGFRETLAIASDLSASLVADVTNNDPQDIAAHGKMLSALAPARRSELVKGALNSGDQDNQAIAIAGLWEGADHLRPVERSRLAEQSLVLASLPNGDPNKEIAVAGLQLGGIKHLTPEQRKQFVTATLSLDPDTRAQAMSGSHWQWGHRRMLRTGQVGESLQYLRAEDRSALVRSLVEMQAPARAMAIGAMSAGFEHLKPEEVKDLVEMVSNPGHPHALGVDAISAIRNMKPGLKFLDETQTNELAKVVSNPEHSHHFPDPCLNADAMASLAPRLKNFDPDELCKVLSNTHHWGYLRDANVSQTLADWGDKLTVFRPEQRSDFVRIITDPDHPRALKGQGDKSLAISGMAQGLVHLKQKERTCLVRAALDLTQSELKAEAIAGLGQGLQHLKQEERSALVRALGEFEDEDDEHKAVAIAGLAKGLAFLQPNERKEITDLSKQLSHEDLVEHGNQFLSMRSLAISRMMAGVNSWQAETRVNKNVVVKELEPVIDRGLTERTRERGLSATR
jgi:hypothetical protein